ncbi:MAG: FAD-dependent monooxygenase [Gammaproteobacteria bacterium]
MVETTFDVLIAGGGLVGSMLALSLADQPLRIGLLDAESPQATQAEGRAIALSYASWQFLQQLNLPSSLHLAATPIKTVHVSNAKHFGAVHLSAQDYGIDALGYVINAKQLQQVLQTALKTRNTIAQWHPAQLTQCQQSAEGMMAKIRTDSEQKNLTTRLLVAADGSRSAVRQWINFPTQHYDYQQEVLVATVETNQPHHAVAYERFIHNGVLAALPLAEQAYTMIWVRPKGETDSGELLPALQQAWGGRLGRLLSVEAGRWFPLHSEYATWQVMPGLVLLGNAAHTLHPIGAQGLNLSIRDIQSLAQMIQHTPDFATLAALEGYQTQRQTDQLRTFQFTHQLSTQIVGAFPKSWLRGIGLSLLDLLPPAKRALVKYTAL